MTDHNRQQDQLLKRSAFMRMLGLSFPGLLIGSFLPSVFSCSDNQQTSENANKNNVPDIDIALVRALVHKAPAEYNGWRIPMGQDYYAARSAAIEVLGQRVEQKKAFDEGEYQRLLMNYLVAPAVEWTSNYNPFKPWENLQIELTGKQWAKVALVLGAVAALPVSATATVVLSAAGLVAGWRALEAPDPEIAIAIHNANLTIAENIWRDPRSREIINDEIKNLLRDSFGIDFDANFAQHREQLSPALQNYLDAAFETNAASQEELAQRIVVELNQSFGVAVDGLLRHMDEVRVARENGQRIEQYNQSEIQGAVYLATLLADKLLGPESGKLVGAFCNSAITICNIMSSVSNLTMGPIGAVAGITNVAMGLAGLFSSQPSAEQVIFEAIGQVQKSVRAMHQDMAKWFGIVVDNQQKILERIDQQFDLLRIENGRNHERVMETLGELRQQQDIIIDEIRMGFRNGENGKLEAAAETLETEIYKKNEPGGSFNRQRVEEAIETAYLYGTRAAPFQHFTLLPPPGAVALRWRAEEITTRMANVDQVDYFIGYLPLFVQKFAGQQLDAPTNPRALGKAIAVISIAYSEFPQIAATSFEQGNRSYLSDLKKLIGTTNKSLLAAVGKNVIDAIKTRYLELANQILSDCLDRAYRDVLTEANIHRDLIIGALAPIQPADKVIIGHPIVGSLGRSSMNVACASPNNANHVAFLTNYLPRDKRYYVTIRDAITPQAGPTYLFRIRKFKGIDPLDAQRVMEFEDLFALAETAGILKVEKGEKKTRQYSLDTYPGYPNINVRLEAEETFIPHKITFLQEAGNTQVILGDGIETGWIISRFSNVRRTCSANGRQFPEQDIEVEYLSKGLIRADMPPFSDYFIPLPWSQGDAALSFSDCILGKLNELFLLRQQLLDKASNALINHGQIREWEAVAHSLKYMAGLNTYVKSGDLDLGTMVVNDTYRYSDNNGVQMPATRKDLQQFINIVCSKEYLYNENKVKKRGNARPEIREYVKNELKLLLEEFVRTFFPPELTKLKLPELSIPALMLETAEMRLASTPG